MKRITIVTQTFPPRTGGMESVMFSLANNLSGLDWAICVVANKSLPGKFKFEHYSISVPKLIRNTAKRIFLSFKDKPDLYLCDSWKSVEAIPQNNIPIVVLAHGQEYLDPKKSKRIVQALNRADKIISSSKATIELITALNKKQASKAICIYPTYGLYENEISTPERSSEAPLKILSLSRIEKRKGLFQSALALRDLYLKGYNLEWNIAGSGPDLEELKLGCADLPFVKFLGRVDDQEKEDLYSSHQLFLMPSYQEGLSLEGFGITYIEAAQFGLASIGGIAGGAKEAVIDGLTGWSVDGSNHLEIRAAITEAYSNRKLLSEYGNNAKQRFDNELVSHKVTNNLSKNLINVIDSSGR